MRTLYIVGTPIGNLEDITLRALSTIFSVDYIACEDTRRTGQLIKSYELKIKNGELKITNLKLLETPKLISYYDEIEFTKLPEIINLLEQNSDVALVSDSGTPLIADPGFKLVSECLKRNIKVVSIPGPSCPITALVSSGLPSNQFLFLGYLPTTQNKRQKLLASCNRYIDESIKLHPTIIFFEAPHRLKESLIDMKEVFGDIEIVIARELTKIHEEIWRGTISQATEHFLQPQGEMVILFSILPK
jgi:16S rRNA (cytidine1402-2'-O)-methyltransferase